MTASPLPGGGLTPLWILPEVAVSALFLKYDEICGFEGLKLSEMSQKCRPKTYLTPQKKFRKKIFQSFFHQKSTSKMEIFSRKKKHFWTDGQKWGNFCTLRDHIFAKTSPISIICFLGLSSTLKGHPLSISWLEIRYSSLSKFFPEKKHFWTVSRRG